MAVCLDYQAVYYRRTPVVISLKLQVVAAALLLATLSFKVWLKIESTEVGYSIATYRQQTLDLDMERRELELHKSFLLRPDHLMEEAKNRLGLEMLKPGQARKITNEG